ncbi:MULTISPECIES: aminotransferase class I/II-fold pyridoxal phosphate-dependent enzyme [unclassified Halomonas]|uniref:aminotransferase class I/II-fold pyridoxal phosphate-dependent enzyme n=1 Tax=unclassified Halomonas TaxID=2609666 RepID=UPI001EF5417E|nr:MULTISPECIES: aminotransferase class I/II-fold pyridoxal phosphate-dependent enzyme [unclassified Halomonas]MCG7577570.1 aminotransferase class I/II-fold pyridoxal phosphate-dependent enzyme [Halomonas sp. MMH1-48]MCG7592082.1 aminotransferase class I/II-fold pyridoxal phosphate-dependent enzyme [Halomonas sp. McD50-5]MCG7604559.1 aminotransferase class I/II-fold pyridoxal phosphate-dependent enzyme [Halomonas sp. MM17-34]MCG7613769.1 aminotransferase class I/II-fold pyridoxal phosphate-depe
MAWNSRVDHVAPFRVMHLLEMAQAREAAGHDVIHLEVGEPDFATPAPIVAAGQQALASGRTRYTPAAGLASLREAIAGHYAEHFNATVDPARILVTPGASGALLLASQLLVENGDRVLMADPNYPCNRHFMALAGAEVDAVSVGRDSGWQLTAPLIEQHWQAKTRIAMLASPSNPTGHTLDAPALAKVIDTVAAKGGDVIVDEIYQGLNYDDAPLSATSLSDDAFVVNSFSKYFGMTGWRLGWLVAPEQAVEPLTRLAQNVFLAAPTPSQHAALAAFTPECRDILETRRATLKQRRQVLLDGLAELGLAPDLPPQGAFYLWLDISRYSRDSQAFCERLLVEENVAITPGIDFAVQGGEHHVRIAFTNDVARLQEAVVRIARFVSRL